MGPRNLNKLPAGVGGGWSGSHEDDGQGYYPERGTNTPGSPNAESLELWGLAPHPSNPSGSPFLPPAFSLLST